MKKLLFIAFIFVTIYAKAQTGIKLTGLTFSNTGDSITLATLYCLPDYTYFGKDSMVSITFYNIASTPSRAMSGRFINVNTYSISIPGYFIKSSIGYPTTTSIFNLIRPYLQGLGFTVTTF